MGSEAFYYCCLFALVGTPSSTSVKMGSRQVTVCSADSSRRGMLSLFAAGAASLMVGQAQALSNVDLNFEIKDKENFYQIYEARDLSVKQKNPDKGSPNRFAFENLSIEDTKARLSKNVARLDEVSTLIEKKYWIDAQTLLRRALGTLRYDIGVLSGGDKNIAYDTEVLFQKIEKLDFALRSKDQEAAKPLFDDADATLKSIISKLV